MRLLVVGSGGREHAIAWFLRKAYPEAVLFVAPGNAGTEEVARNVPVSATDIPDLVALARQEAVDFVVVGPEQPLVLGLADALRAEGIPVVGPSAGAARLEGSKAFAKAFMARHGIPTAEYRTFRREELEAARSYLNMLGAPVVVKASGLAAGKGAVVCHSLSEAQEALEAMLVEGVFGEAGDEVVIEDFMEGEEVSVFVATDGRRYAILAPAQDHKRIGEGDTGPNTGGMGAYAPAPLADEALMERIRRTIVEPTLEGMAAEGYPYEGFLYCGLMVTEDGPRVVEYNCRLGDPEAQVVLPLLNYGPLFEELARGRLGVEGYLRPDRYAACVVMASRGYPGPYEKGKVISGLEEAAALPDVLIFHAGTARDASGNVVTAGGRVLGVTGLGDTLREALDRAYAGVALISFEGAYFRRDIGQKGLQRLQEKTM